MGRIITQTPTVDTDAYTAGDAVGGLLTFNIGATRTSEAILQAELLDNNGTPVEAAMSLYLFTDPSMVIADDDPFTITLADYQLGKVLSKIDFVDYEDFPVGGATKKRSLQADLKNIVFPTGGLIYGQLVCDGTPTFAGANSLTVALHMGEYA